jgi:hypothetical protein
MTEVAENTSAEAGSEVAVSTSFIGEDGNFTENWMETAGVHEDLRGNQTLLTTKNVASMASQLVNAQKMIGANTTTIPNEQSTEVEWAEFHKACGRPDTPDEYQITHAEGMEIDAEVEGALKNLAHSHGLRPATVQALIELDDQRMLAMNQAIEDAKVQRTAECEETLKKQWGAAYDERVHLANRMVAENATEENKAEVLDAIGSNPIVCDFLANMAKKFVEHKVISADVTQPTPNDALAEADVLRNTPGYITGELANTSPAKFKQITEQITALMKKAYPE